MVEARHPHRPTLTQLPPVRLKLGEGIPVNAKGRPYVTDQLLEILRRQYEEQVRAASDRFGERAEHGPDPRRASRVFPRYLCDRADF